MKLRLPMKGKTAFIRLLTLKDTADEFEDFPPTVFGKAVSIERTTPKIKFCFEKRTLPTKVKIIEEYYHLSCLRAECSQGS